jgi:hypothetical protein
VVDTTGIAQVVEGGVPHISAVEAEADLALGPTAGEQLALAS